MSKRFKPQDYFRYKKLGTSWRRPKGRQTKLRVGKSGSGLLVKVGYGTKGKEKVPLISSWKDLDKVKGAALIAADVGAKRVIEIAAKAKERGVKILNMKKVRRAEKIALSIKTRKEAMIKEKATQAAKKEETSVKKEG